MSVFRGQFNAKPIYFNNRARSSTRALALHCRGFLTRVTIVWIPGYGVIFKSIRKQWVTHYSGAAGLHVGTFSLVLVSLSIEFTASETTDAFSPQKIFGTMEPA